MSSGQSSVRLDAPVCRLDEELFPEITLLDDTYDSTLSSSVLATPLTAGSMKSRFVSLQPPQLSPCTNLSTALLETRSNNSTSKENNSEVHSPELSKHNGTTASDHPGDKIVVDPSESMYAPERFLDVRYFPEITLLEVTRDSEQSQGGELSPMEPTQDTPAVDRSKNNMPPSEFSGRTVAEPGRSGMIQSGELSSTLTSSITHTTSFFSEQSDKSVGENITQASLEVTRDISAGNVLGNSEPLLEHSRHSMVKIHTSAEDTLEAHPANVTRDISPSSDMSVQCAASEFSTSDMQSKNGSHNVTSELHSEAVMTSNTVEAHSKELPSSHDAELTSKVPQPSPLTGSVNGTFTSTQPSRLSSSTDINNTSQIPRPQNKTLDLPSSNEDIPKVESESTDQATSVSKNTPENSLVLNQNCLPVNAAGSCDMSNATFDPHSLRKSSGSTILGEAGAGNFCLHNTFDTKPPSKQNGTITLSETSSTDSHQNSFNKPLQVCNATSSPKENSSARLQSGPPVADGLSDTLAHESVDMENNKANTIVWDDSLNLRADPLITSTPMPDCKVFVLNTKLEEGKIVEVQKKLYGDAPNKPDGQVPSDVPSNIVCDRKTFLRRPAAKSLLPPLKAASQLLKHKPASALSGKSEPLTSGLPMTRQRTQAEALRNTAASDAPQETTGISSSYALRATTTGSKQPSSGLQRPQLSGIPSAIQRTASGLRPASARGTATSSSTNKLRGPTAIKPVMKTSQAKKQPLTRGEALPIAKRKRMDAPLPPVRADVSASSCDAANGAKNLKQPTTNKRALPPKTQRDEAAMPASTAAETSTSGNTVSRVRALKQPVTSHRVLPTQPKSHGCANCSVLEQQLKIQSEEIRRLKEELLKKREEEDG